MRNDDLIIEAPTTEDREWIVELLRVHREETGSAVAERLLADLEAGGEAAEAVWGRFTTLLPRQFDLVRRTRAAAEEEGLDPDGDTVWNRLLEVTRG